jgi:hypothetical protein
MAKKKAVKKRVKKKVKKETLSDDVIPIDWKIPAAFLAGVIVTYLFFQLSNITPSTGAGSASNIGDVTQVSDAHVTLFVLNDAGCSVCDASWIEPRVKIDFSNITVNYVDAGSAQGQDYINTLGITSLPAAFFTSDFTQAVNASAYQNNQWVVPVGSYYVLNIQGTMDLTREESETPRVDLFVMSECPYGVPAQQAMIDAKSLIPGFELIMHYIGNVYSETEWNALSTEYQNYYEQYGMCEQKTNNKYYCSLHGPGEVENNIAQLCAMNYYEDWTSFIEAHINNNMNISKAIQEVGYNETLMNECINSEIGWDLYEEDITIAEERLIGSSPTYVYDNVIRADQLLLMNGPAGLLCTLHEELSGCESVDSLEVAQATGSC